MKISTIEKAKIYLAIGIFMIGYIFGITMIMSLSAGIFLGLGTYYYWEGKKDE